MTSSFTTGEGPPQAKTRQVSAQKRLFSVEQAAHYLGLSKWTVYDMIKDGTLRCVRRGKRMLIDIQDLDGFIEANKE